jgi:hypothetical protein
MTINGVACGLKSVSRHSIVFVVPQALSSTTDGTSYPVVINNQGTVMKTTVTIVPARPDVFNTVRIAAPGGRALMYNITNRVHTTEPFTTFTVRLRGGQRVPSVMRIYVTGVANTTSSVISMRIGPSLPIVQPRILTGGVMVEPGVYTIDFLMPSEINGAGDQPVIVTVTAAGVSFNSRLDDTAPRVRIL